MENFLHMTIIASTPLLFAVLGEIFTEKVGVLNLGVEGLMMIGAVTSFLVALHTNNPYLSILIALLSGMLLSSIFMVLTVFLRSSQVVSGISLSIFGIALANFLGKSIEGTLLPINVKEALSQYKLPVLGDIKYIGEIFFNQSPLVYFSYLMVAIFVIYFKKTQVGLNSQAIGENPLACDTIGIKITTYKCFHILIGGAFCALGGAFLSLVYVPAWQENITSGRGWIVIALVIFAKWNPFKGFIISYLFGALSLIGFKLQSMGIHLEQYFTDMLPYLFTILAIVFDSIKDPKNTLGPRFLGNNYYRE